MGCGICITTLNIRLGRAGSLETALHVLRQGNIGIRVLQETKLTGGIHMQRSSGYTVRTTEAESQHRGGIAIFWKDREELGVEGVRNFGPNWVSFIIQLGQKFLYGAWKY